MGILMDRMKRMEYNFVLAFISRFPKNISILDAGCGEGKLTRALNDLGYKAIGVDLKPWGKGDSAHTFFSKPRIRKINYRKEDLRNLSFPDKSFDIIFCINTLHTLGLNRSPGKKEERGDLKALDEFKRILKDKGFLILTLAFGEASFKKNRTYRVYDESLLEDLLKGFLKIEEYYYYGNYGEGKWTQTTNPKEVIKAFPKEEEHWQGDVWLILKKDKK